MRHRSIVAGRIVASLAVVLALPSTLGATTASAGSSPAYRAVCGPVPAGHARCFAVVSSASASAHVATPAGYGATTLESAYNLPVQAGGGQTIAIVDAFDDPTAADDLAVYRKTYHLPACTTANGCFEKLNQKGVRGHPPVFDPGWAIEISLDLDMVSAACPRCHIVLVEANTSLVSDLGITENTAARLGVDAITNSYGLPEFNGMQKFSPDYRHPGTTILAATGDFGFGPAQFPAVLTRVVAVGGTTLTTAHNARGWSESAWNGAGSGCSAYIPKPSWQKDDHCFMRTVGDVSADADPTPGLAVYDTSIPQGFGLDPGWITVGGTSASSPFVAGVIGLAGNGASMAPGFAYHHRQAFFDAVGGSNGFCGGDYLCTGRRGYDAPTGLGTPDTARGL